VLESHLERLVESGRVWVDDIPGAPDAPAKLAGGFVGGPVVVIPRGGNQGILPRWTFEDDSEAFTWAHALDSIINEQAGQGPDVVDLYDLMPWEMEEAIMLADADLPEEEFAEIYGYLVNEPGYTESLYPFLY
jgi:hypothetical protein